jgi:hypothetical protein
MIRAAVREVEVGMAYGSIVPFPIHHPGVYYSAEAGLDILHGFCRLYVAGYSGGCGRTARRCRGPLRAPLWGLCTCTPRSL